MSTPSFSHLPDGLKVASAAMAPLTQPAHVAHVAHVAPGSPAVAPAETAETAGAESDLLLTVGAAITRLFPGGQIALPERGGILAGAAGTDSTREIRETQKMQEQRDRHRIQALLEQAEALGHPFEIVERFPSQSLLKAIEAPDAQERLGSDAPASRQPGYVRIRFANDPHDPPIEAIISDAALPCLPNLPGLPSLPESHQTPLVQAAPGGVSRCPTQPTLYQEQTRRELAHQGTSETHSTYSTNKKRRAIAAGGSALILSMSFLL